MSETTSNEIAIPSIGEIVQLDDYRACSLALDHIRYLESQFREAKSILSRAIAEEAARQGTRTLELTDGRKAVVSSGSEIQYDAEGVKAGLLAAGMPPERVYDIVEETVVRKVRAVEAKRAANANPAYATVIDENSREVDKPVVVSIRRS